MKEYPDGAKWTCDTLSSGFMITREYKGKETRHAAGSEKDILWDFCKWLMEVRSIDDYITISFEHRAIKFTV